MLPVALLTQLYSFSKIDPPEYYHLYGIPAAGTMAFYTAGTMSGHVPEIDSAAATLSGLLCIGGIAGLSSQSTARLGAASGQAGVALGVASTLGHLHPDLGTTAKIATLMGIGGLAGKYIGDRVEPTSLPQTVAAFHSLVGVAASAAAIGDFANAPSPADLDKVHLASVYLATVIGSVTCTGSLVAFGKLDGRMGSAPMQHPARDQINMGLGAATLGAGAVVMGGPEVVSYILSDVLVDLVAKLFFDKGLTLILYSGYWSCCVGRSIDNQWSFGLAHDCLYWRRRYACGHHRSQLVFWLGIMCGRVHA